MCGLLATTDRAIRIEQFQRAQALMTHRGPDAEGSHADSGNALLGHRRLSVLDLDPRSNQPFCSDDGRYSMVYNGEIYNFRELARQFDLPLHTSGDTEVLLKLWMQLGADVLGHLNGMFAFVIYDNITRDLFVARDRLGVKPLYYLQVNDGMTLASEIAPILALYPSQDWDDLGVRQYRKMRTFFNDRTLYSNIRMFPAGCYLKNGRISRYWSLPEGPQAPPTDEELRSLIIDAVALRNRSDVPVGSYLSGGIDSTVVAALAGQPHTWTVGSASSNEFEWARMAAEHIGSTHHEIVIDESNFLPTASQLIRQRREPLSVPNEVLLYQMTQHVSELNTVVLSGEGADELFFGYDRIFRWAVTQDQFDIQKFDELYSYGSHQDNEVLEDVLAPFQEYGQPLDVVAAFFQVAHLHGLLRRLDNATMMCGVEARVPFVDYRLVERMAGVSFNYRVRSGQAKAPLKRIFADLLPKPIVERPKVGFPVSLDRVFSRPMDATCTNMDSWLDFNLKEVEFIGK